MSGRLHKGVGAQVVTVYVPGTWVLDVERAGCVPIMIMGSLADSAGDLF